jgi:hypothetical protein
VLIARDHRAELRHSASDAEPELGPASALAE